MESTMMMYVKLSDRASTPKRESADAAGYDLSSAYDYVVEPKGKCLCQTDLQLALPAGTYGRIAPRSGLALKKFIDVGAGVIDGDYRGNVGVLIFNFSDQLFKISSGDRIAQLIVEKIWRGELKERESLAITERGDEGFGSSGIA